MIRYKPSCKYAATIIILLLALLLSAISLLRIYTKANDREVVVVWGRQDEKLGDCKVWIIDPTIGITEQSFESQEDCRLKTTVIANKLRLISISYPGQITIYQIDAQNNMIPESIIELGEWGIGSIPQWGNDGKIYFSSIVNDVEQILQADIQSKKVDLFIANEKGLASEPIISPDGRHLVYWTIDGPTNTNPQICGLDCISGYYHIYDLENNTDIDLRSLIDPILADSSIIHCNAKWSPTGQYLAFNIGGCDSNLPTNVIVYDTYSMQIVTGMNDEIVPNSEKQNQTISFQGWFSDNEIVIGIRTIFPNMNFDGEEFYIYSIEEDVARKFINLPTYNENGQEFILMEPSWAQDEEKSTGIVPTIAQNRTLEKDLLIIQDGESSQFQYIKTQDIDTGFVDGLFFNLPVWSPSGDWIAFHSNYAEDIGSSTRLADLNIINTSGYEEKHFSVNGILENSLGITWIVP